MRIKNNLETYNLDLFNNQSKPYLESIVFLVKLSLEASEAYIVFGDSEAFNFSASTTSKTPEKQLIDKMLEFATMNETVKMGTNFYATYPILVDDDLKLGVLITEFKIHHVFSDNQQHALSHLSNLVSIHLTERANTRNAFKIETEILHRIVHDFKNPNMSISLAAEVITKKSNDPKIVSTFAEKIKLASQKLVDNINRVYDFANVESAKFRTNFSVFNINLLFGELINSIIKDKDANSSLILITSEDLKINADYERLYQTLEELILNATRFSNKNNKVYLSAKETDNEYLIEVKDEGFGLNPEEVEDVFKKFSKRPYQSLATVRGYGLTQVKTLVSLQKGNLEIESKKNKGSTFRLRLPK